MKNESAIPAAAAAFLAQDWPDAYLAFKGAFDTPQMRRMLNDEYSEDARRRLRAFDEAFTAALEGEQTPEAAETYDAIWNALQRIETAAVFLPTFDIRHEGGIEAVTQNIVDAMALAAKLRSPQELHDKMAALVESHVQWESCDCGCPGGRSPKTAADVNLLRIAGKIRMAAGEGMPSQAPKISATPAPVAWRWRDNPRTQRRASAWIYSEVEQFARDAAEEGWIVEALGPAGSATGDSVSVPTLLLQQAADALHVVMDEPVGDGIAVRQRVSAEVAHGVEYTCRQLDAVLARHHPAETPELQDDAPLRPRPARRHAAPAPV